MKKSKIYTKTGDEGETGLVSGNRISKSDIRIDMYGELDELNSRIGFALTLLNDSFSNEIEFNHKIQSALFDLGSNMACEFENRAKFNLPQINKSLITDLETNIDKMDNELEALKSFILPGGSKEAAALHLARTSTRNCERKLFQYSEVSTEELPPLSLIFLNRLSDYYFVLARYVNFKLNKKEILWKPGN